MCIRDRSRYEMKYKKSFLMTVLFMSSLPGTVLIVPVYRMFVTLKLNDSLGGIILFMAATTLPYSLWMMKNFMDSVPLYLEEAASVDGAGTCLLYTSYSAANLDMKKVPLASVSKHLSQTSSVMDRASQNGKEAALLTRISRRP